MPRRRKNRRQHDAQMLVQLLFPKKIITKKIKKVKKMLVQCRRCGRLKESKELTEIKIFDKTMNKVYMLYSC